MDYCCLYVHNFVLSFGLWVRAQDHLKGKMFRVGSMGETPVEEMIEGCKRMLDCFREFGVNLKDVDGGLIGGASLEAKSFCKIVEGVD